MHDKYNQFKKIVWFTWDGKNEVNHIAIKPLMFSKNDIDVNKFILNFSRHFKLILQQQYDPDLKKNVYAYEDMTQGFKVYIALDNYGVFDGVHLVKTEKISF